ncbi:hypothetical protein [Agromyces sp. SYSU T00266]|uniref:hypothetical protein n=1 Tax=Agromyces zhanjiangensis TaxID=3158562 RepID=UPI003393A6CF
MQRTYSMLGYLLATLVVLQAGAIAWFVSGMFRWINDGAYLDAAVLAERGDPHFPEELGIAAHSLNGIIVIPAVGLALLIVSFFTRDRVAMILAGVVLALIVLQTQLGFWGPELPAAGLVHGMNALAILLVATLAAVRMGRRIKLQRRESAAQDADATPVSG